LKKLIIITLLSLSFTAYSDDCIETNNELETSSGSFVFNSLELCKEAYNVGHDCDVAYAKLQKKDPKANLVPCNEVLKKFMDVHSSEVTTVIANDF
jgi:hypothetical protein